MINVINFINFLKNQGIDYYTGVPDSLMKNFCDYINSNKEINNIVNHNEGGAIAFAAGNYLTNKKPCLVYLQNSGQGNCINPLISLTHPKVYSIPMLLLIGWRGEPEIKDEPQHMKQGEITEELLQLCDIPFEILDIENWKSQIEKANNFMIENKSPFAILVKKNTFEKTNIVKKENNFNLVRENVLKKIIQNTNDDQIIFSTTGKISREIYEVRKELNKESDLDFYNVGAMGHVSQIALGASFKTNKKILCIDGDGSLIMHMGTLATIGSYQPNNFVHILINNEAHESVGGQKTASSEINFLEIAKGCNYKYIKSIINEQELDDFLKNSELKYPAFIEIKVKLMSRDNLKRPEDTTLERKEKFLNKLENAN